MKMCDLHAPAPVLIEYPFIIAYVQELLNWLMYITHHTLTFLCLYVIVITCMCLHVPV